MTAFEIDRPSAETTAPHLAVKTPSSNIPFYRKLYVQVLIAVVLGAILVMFFRTSPSTSSRLAMPL